MSFKNSRRAKSILASLLIASNFTNIAIQNAKCMETSHQNAVPDINTEDFRCITDDYLLDLYGAFVSYYDKRSDFKTLLEDEFEKEFESLNIDIFKGGLIKNYIHMNRFAQYVVWHTIKAFLDKNEEFKEMINLCHTKSKKIIFALYDFKEGDKLVSKIAETLEENNKNLKNYTDESVLQHYVKYKLEHLLGCARGFGKVATLGLRWTQENIDDYTRVYIDLAKCLSRSKVGPYVAIDMFWDGIGEKTSGEIAKMNADEVFRSNACRGLLCLIYTTIHELAHSIPRYLHLLELMVDEKYNSDSDKKFAKYSDDITDTYENWEEYDLPTLKDKAKAWGIDEETFKGIDEFRKSLGKHIENSGHTEYADTEYVKKRAQERTKKRTYEAFGYANSTVLGATNEDIAEAFAYESMPSNKTFENRKKLVKAYEIYTRKLLKILKDREIESNKSNKK